MYPTSLPIVILIENDKSTKKIENFPVDISRERENMKRKKTVDMVPYMT